MWDDAMTVNMRGGRKCTGNRLGAGTLLATLALALIAGAGPALAGQAMPWQLGFQKAASPMMEAITEVNNLLLVIITLISIFVLVLLFWVVVRYNRRANPNPANFSHNTLIEVIWTAVPVMILAVIALYSFPLMYYIDEIPETDLTIKATGYQWYWGYEYPDHGGFEFTSNMIPEAEIDDEADYFGNPRVYRLSVDNDIVVPVGKTVRLEITAFRVLHNFAVPSFGLKTDAVPGRLNETWFRVDEPGIYYGQCSEICGPRHAFMPIAIRAVSEEEFAAWVGERKAELADAASTEQKFASAQ